MKDKRSAREIAQKLGRIAEITFKKTFLGKKSNKFLKFGSFFSKITDFFRILFDKVILRVYN